MKQLLLSTAIMLMVLITLGQSAPYVKPGLRNVTPPKKQLVEPLNPASVILQKHLSQPQINYLKNSDIINIINIGTSGNAYGYGYAGGQRTLVWADQNLNTVTNIHRMGGDLGGVSDDLAYDISRDGGLTWDNQVMVFEALGSGSNVERPRYPNHCIYNPPGNTNPDNAYVAFLAAMTNLNNATPVWGEYVHGHARIGDISDTTRTILPSDTVTGIYFDRPTGYTITQAGEIWAADVSVRMDPVSYDLSYFGKIIVSHGTWDESIDDFSFEVFTLDFSTLDNQMPLDVKVAFSPDGMNGWIGAISDNGSVSISAGRSLYPILWNTTDGGETWEGPIPAPVAGPDAPDGILNFLTDDQLEELFGVPIPSQEEIEFTIAYDFDMHSDAWGQPHIAVVIGITGEDPYSFITGISESSDFMYAAPFDLTYNTNSGFWYAIKLGPLKTLRGQFDDITEDNRIQVASSWDGKYMFFTWLDTQLPGCEDNNQPDIWTRGLAVSDYFLSHYWDEYGNSINEPVNVTIYSEAMWQAYFQATSHYVLFEDGDPYFSFTLPMVYEDMEPYNFYDDVQFRYITGFKYHEYNFGCFPPPPGIAENAMNQIGFVVTTNSPNPVKSSTTFYVELDNAIELSIEVCNMTGQSVIEIPEKNYPHGNHPILLDLSHLPSGVYIYSVISKEHTVTHKMVKE